MRQLVLTAVILLLGAAGVAARAQLTAEGSDIQEGHRLALRICYACHIVASDQEEPPILHNPAPSFQSIADRPGTTAASLRNFMLTTHRTIATPANMPNLQLTADQVTQLVSYILSLRRSAPPRKN
jgi:mono/diheme cytochrome c family protein